MEPSLKAILSNEVLARFIFSDKHFAKNPERIKYAAFMPPDGKRDVSVFRITGLTEDEIWHIGKEVGEKRPSPLKARANIEARKVLEEGVTIEPTINPPRHANICLPESSSYQKLIAIKLAKKARLTLFMRNIF